MVRSPPRMVYRAPAPTNQPAKRLVFDGAPSDVEGFVFYERLEIGRFRGSDPAGVLLVHEPTVSSRHCVISQDDCGRCWVWDMSRNGTRLDGRRLSPNLRTEMRIGQVLTVAEGVSFRLVGDAAAAESSAAGPVSSTLGMSNPTFVSVLVGDIRNYTVLVQEAPSIPLQRSVGRVFARLEREVVKLGGTLKEFQGDALFAFWEKGADNNPAQEACAAALELHRLAAELARDPEVWALRDHPLRLDWALATGPVVISGHGSDGALGLSMVGRSVVLAFRIEQFADDSTGAIVACRETRDMACKRFKFRDLGRRTAKGFEGPLTLFALTGRRMIAL